MTAKSVAGSKSPGSRFGRSLANFDDFAKLENKPQWWWDLLSLWQPSGVDSGPSGLRLAIRNGYLNFYRLGQSIARVQFNSGGTPSATVHLKYLLKREDAKGIGQEYVSLKENWMLREHTKWREYEGIRMLESWIQTVNGQVESGGDKGYTGAEKCQVDQLVAANANVVDLEMGLPAFGTSRRSPRMDLVALEQRGDALCVVFWEAKLVTDGRMRCDENVVTTPRNEMKPEVLKQLYDYREFLGDPERRDLVAAGYVDAARLIVKIKDMAAKEFPSAGAGGNAIVSAANGGKLLVDCEPRVVVVADKRKSFDRGAWEEHKERLDNDAGVKVLDLSNEQGFELRLPS